MEHSFPSEPHQVAKEGTAAHWVAKACFKNPSVTPESMIGQIHENSIAVDGEMAEHVTTYLEEVRSLAVQPEHLYIEQNLSMAWIHPDASGPPDAWYYCVATQTLYLWDFKYGWRTVNPEKNWQFVEYLAGILAFLGAAPVKRIETVVVQPRPPHYQGRIRRWHTTVEELGPLFAELQTAAVEATGNNPLCRTGEWCRDCRALAQCPYAQDAALAAIEVSGRVTLAAPSPEEMATEMYILQAAKEAISLRLAAIETVAVASLETGGMVPGWALERSYGRRKWRGSNEELRAVEVLTGLSLFEEKPVTPAEAKRRGLDDVTRDIYAETPETGNKLVQRDLNKKASEVFGANPGE